MFGAIEAGGTKFVCAVFEENMKVIESVTIPTEAPETTMKQVIEFFGEFDIKSLGIGAFGPIEINPKNENYGQFLNTPKIKWRSYNIYKALKAEFDIPIVIDTDVNAAALGEYREGYGKDKDSVLYITIGTGVGAGYVNNNVTLNGLTHPEMGHLLIRPMEEDKFEGVCPSHGNCLEGMVAGPAIEKRCGAKGHTLEKNHPVWGYVADYVGQACMSFALTLCPEIILIGGGVSRQEQLFPMIHDAFKKHMNGYLDHPTLKGDLSEYIRYPKNGQEAGLIGSMHLALQAAKMDKVSCC